ncbi:MAG: hypothetical protein CSA04_05350 [Bacteroidetes bacterium]|nr:MAG: hypothetical protein CSA04_05350 [Bacteroidota bacterium]
MACNNSGTQSTNKESAAKETSSIIEVDVPTFLKAPKSLTGKQVRIKGEVAHVCKHGGKRLFLMHPDCEDRVKVTADDNIPAFKQELEGSVVVVTGLVEELKVDKTYLDEWQAEVEAESHKESEKKIHTGGADHEKEAKEGEDHDENDHAMEQINAMREKLKNSEEGYLSFFSIACETIDEVK